jgi:hypothetical protein
MGSTIDCRSEPDNSVRGQKTLLKTFTYEYWQVATERINLLPHDLQKTGLVVGDFHFNNLGIYFDENTAKAKPVINDFDDAGNNYLVVDLSKYLAFLKTEVKKVDLNKAINADKKQQEAQEFDVKSLNTAQTTILEYFTRHESLSSLRKPNVIFRVNDTGSSLGMELYEFVGRNNQNKLKVIEFKQLKCSGSGARARQDLTDNYNAVQSFYNKHFPSDYMSSQKIIFYNSNFYLVREKINNPLKKIDVDKMSDADQQEYADYYANFLGLIHSKSAGSKYLAAVTQNTNEILKYVKKISEEFNSEVK